MPDDTREGDETTGVRARRREITDEMELAPQVAMRMSYFILTDVM